MKKGKFKFVKKELFRMAGCAKGCTVLVVLLGILTAVFDLLYTDALNRLFASVTERQWNKVLIAAFLTVGGILILQDVLNAVVNYAMAWQSEKARKGYTASFLEKVDRLSAVQMQNPEILNTINSVRNGQEESIQFLIHAENLFSDHLVYFILIMIYLYRMHPLLMAAVLIAYIPSVLSYKLKNKVNLQKEERIAVYRRQRDAFFNYVTGKEFFKETRFRHTEDLFKGKFEEADTNFQKGRKQSFVRQNLISLFTNFTYVLGLVAMLAVILYLVQSRALSVAEVATALTIVLSIYEHMNEMLNSDVAGMAESLGGLLNMHRLMQLAPQDGTVSLDGEGYEVVLTDVSFAYPDAEICAIDNLSLHIRNGEILAIVGENGSGKTTLSKILCGLYRPSGGTMTINGKNRQEISRESLMKRVSAVFQNFNKYPLTVKENIVIADVDKEESREELDRLVAFSGIDGKIAEEEKGYDTLLSRDFGGVDWSGGLWQRLAIARAAYKECDFFVFDEPTAAIDPLEEISVMQKMLEYAKGKTAVLVTHRIGAAKLADRIIVMAHGNICEMGTHDELLMKNGEYARMYEAQKQWYC